MASVFSIVVLSSLAILALAATALLASRCLRAHRGRLARGGMLVFAAGACIATLSAQKNVYVDRALRDDLPLQDQLPANIEYHAAVRTITEAFEFLDGKVFDGARIYVAPGVYPPVVVPEIRRGESSGPMLLTPYCDVLAIGEAGSVVIDGMGCCDAISHAPGADVANLWVYPRQWHGVVLSNAVCGARAGFFARCVATDCEVGFSGCELEQCLVYANRRVGIVGCRTTSCLVADNRAEPGSTYAAAGAMDSELSGTIVWGNFIGGGLANVAGCSTGYYGCNCTLPAIPGDGNISADPMFVDPARRDYRLRMGSPCINAMTHGLSLWEFEGRVDWSYDFGLCPRIERSAADIGPYEYVPTNDQQTITAPVPVEFAWIGEKCPEILAAAGGDFDRAVLMKSANPVDLSLPEDGRTYMSVWESYVADLDPTDSNQTFRATIEMEGGRPVVRADPESERRRYTVLGKVALDDAEWVESLPGARFFKVIVELR